MTCRVIKTSRNDYYLQVNVTTSTLEDHSSFDYENMVQELSPNITSSHQFTLSHKFIHIYRQNKTFQISFKERQNLKLQQQQKESQHLGVFQIRYVNKNIILRFYEAEDLLSDRKFGTFNGNVLKNEDVHHMYAIVRSFKNQNGESKGYKMSEGSFLKIGQKQFFVSSLLSERQKYEGNIQQKLMLVDSILNTHKRITTSNDKKPGQCKYCMIQQGQGQTEFLCSPCKCSGSCAMVHFECLQKWNQSKVKKNQVKGLTYYNFDKFFCEVCKEQYPKFIEKGDKVFELMPIEMPKGQHIILQEIDIKNSSLICIQNIPQEGIRMGRGNECQIRVDSQSISRNHARIIKQHGQYSIFDNKSKFGTLVRDNKIYLQVDMTRKGIQIDRTVLMFNLSKRNLLS